MRRLTLVRHAHAESKTRFGTDFERSLTRRGHIETEALGKRLLDQSLVPDLLIASPAQRTRQTAELLARDLSLTASAIKYDQHLYLATAGDILRIVRAVDTTVLHLMIVCHNPGVSDLAHLLAPQEGAALLDTAAARTVTFDIDTWKNVSA